MDAPDEWFWKCRLAFARFPETQIIFITGRDDPSVRQTAVDATFAFFLQNPSKTRLFWGFVQKSESDVALRLFPFGPARPRPEPPDKVTWLEAAGFPLIYRERKKKGTSRSL